LASVIPGPTSFYPFSNNVNGTPHGVVHGAVGGNMTGFNFAGLDPIFWLHHCNIDRLWEAWMNAPGRTMVREARWLEGPLPLRFVMPRPDGSAQQFIPRDTLKGGSLYPTYDDISIGTALAPAPGSPQ